ncbi:pyridoxamine 5'-phosphate oxidase family protein [Lysobacter auxotrophicus]|uniref:Pyridoxamine 5'-phosphate oxidase family protein n=1 Tax=Lysobacter auxotrophicus TaxID=2992573 RepID=A0ABN6UI88_9GAMM|nr:pyridoxamine 5'-phosphate oxidase family protein [Lysobacter auxotrophicus]
MAGIDRNVKRIGELLKKIDIAMLTTTGEGGFLMSRPLSTQDARFDGRRVWFFTETDSPKVAEIRRNPKVNLAYASKGKNVYISMTGTARVNRDREMIEELWNDAMKAFFPKGKNDPNLTLLEVDVHSVEYWDGPGSWIGKAVSFIIARVTKNEEVMGENRIVDLSEKRPRKRLPPSHKDARSGAKRAAAKAPKKAAKTVAKKATAKRTGTAKKAAAKRTSR